MSLSWQPVYRACERSILILFFVFPSGRLNSNSTARLCKKTTMSTKFSSTLLSCLLKTSAKRKRKQRVRSKSSQAYPAEPHFSLYRFSTTVTWPLILFSRISASALSHAYLCCLTFIVLPQHAQRRAMAVRLARRQHRQRHGAVTTTTVRWKRRAFL